MAQNVEEFCWNVDSDSSSSGESWDEFDSVQKLLESERMTRTVAATPQWRQKQFYQTQFPLVLIEKLFASNEFDRPLGEIFESRNFVFILPSKAEEKNITTQYRSFRSPVEMRDAFIHNPPLRIEVGSRGSEPACILPAIVEMHANRGDIDPHYLHTRELTFDVDITDWSDIRDCNCVKDYVATDVCTKCKRAKDIESDLVSTLGYCECEAPMIEVKLCSRCWCYLRGSIMIMNYILTRQYGFRQILFVFSGSKGYHCWVFDKAVKSLTDQQRWQIVHHFDPWIKVKNIKDITRLKDESLVKDSILFDRNNSFLEPLFKETIVSSGVFNLGSSKVNKLLDKFLDIDAQPPHIQLEFLELFDLAIVEKWSSTACWDNLKSFITHKLPGYFTTVYIRRIIYAFIFPRIDEPITAQIKHLIKLPYSLHPTTRLISVPILTHELLSFDPTVCPNVFEQNQIDRSMQETDEQIDLYMNPLYNTYYCPHCHPVVPVEELCKLFTTTSPRDFSKRFVHFCFKRIEQFRLFKSVFRLNHHIKKQHPDIAPAYQNLSSILSEWIYRLSTSDGYCNMGQFELLSLSFLFLMKHCGYLETLPINIETKLAGLNL